MRFHRPLDTLFKNASRVRILRFFCLKGGEWSGRRLANELGMNPVTAHSALRALHQATVLKFKRVGASFAYSLNETHYLVRTLLRPAFLAEAQAQERLTERLRRSLPVSVRSQIVSMALFGSVAKRQERPTSDLDLLVLVESAASKEAVRQALNHQWAAIVGEFGNSLAPYVNTVQEARQKAHRQLPIFQEILKHHTLLFGAPLKEAFNGR